MRRPAALLAVTAAAVAIPTGAAQAARTFSVADHQTSFRVLVDKPPKGTVSRGDVYTFNERLTRRGRRVGLDHVRCVGLSRHAVSCRARFIFARGSILGRVIVRDTDRSDRGRVTGGTGAYRRARGTFTVGRSDRITFRVSRGPSFTG